MDNGDLKRRLRSTGCLTAEGAAANGKRLAVLVPMDESSSDHRDNV